MKLQPITIKVGQGSGKPKKNVVLYCLHRADWPPAHARLDDTLESLRASGVITDHKYQQLQTWERLCGLMRMKASKCSTCPMALHETPKGLVPYAPSNDPKRPLPPFAKAKIGRNR